MPARSPCREVPSTRDIGLPTLFFSTRPLNQLLVKQFHSDSHLLLQTEQLYLYWIQKVIIGRGGTKKLPFHFAKAKWAKSRQSSNWMFSGLFFTTCLLRWLHKLNLQILLMSHSEMINGNASAKSLAGNNAAHWQLIWTDWWPFTFSLVMCLLMSSFVDQSEFNHWWQPSKGDSVLQLIDGRLWDLCWCETFGRLISMYMLYASLHSWFWTTCHYCLILH